MEIVIKIPDGIYDFLKEHPDRQFPYATEWIRHGTPLPKGHGRLIDVGEANSRMMMARRRFDTFTCFTSKLYMDLSEAVVGSKTIVEADEGEQT